MVILWDELDRAFELGSQPNFPLPLGARKSALLSLPAPLSSSDLQHHLGNAAWPLP